MNRDKMYFAREDLAFNAWLDARKTTVSRMAFALQPEAVRDLLRSAFTSGVRFGSEEAEIQRAVSESKAG